MSGKNPLGNGKEPQSYEGTNAIFPISGFNVIKSKTDPGSNKKFPVPSLWLNTVSEAFWIQVAPGTWVEISTSSGTVLSVTGTTNQIAAAPTSGNVVLAFANPLTTPGPATINGNLTISGAGTGLITTPTVVAAGASPQTANGRVFAVTFSGVSIASGASQTFVISNTSITGAGTQVLLGWAGATAGSGLSISSQASTASTLTIIMTNATSATMVTSVANITFTGLVLN